MIERLGKARPRLGEIDRRLVGGLDPQHLQRHAVLVGPPGAGTALRSARAGRDFRRAAGCRTARSASSDGTGARRSDAAAGRAPAEPHAELGAAESSPAAARCRLRLALPRRCRDRPAGNAIAPAPRGRAAPARQRCVEPVVPRGRRIGQRALELGEIGRRAVRRVELQRVERLGERRLGAARAGDRGHLAVPRLLQDVGGSARSAPHRSARAARTPGSSRSGRRRSRRDEQRHPAPLLELQDAERMVVERVGVDLEQLVARIGVEDGQQRLAVMAVGSRPARRSTCSTRPRSSGTSRTIA